MLDQRAVFAPITNATFLLDAGAAHVIADNAVGIATEGQPGPVFIDIPIRVAEAQVPAIAPTPRAVAADVVPDATTLQQIAGWLSQAARPVIVAGVDALNDGADVAGLARRFGVPVVTTYKAKGLLPEDDALSMGGAGLSPLADKTLLPLVQSADLVLCLGYDPIEMRTGWRDVWNSTAQRVIEVTAVPNHHYMHQSTVNIVGSVRATVTALMHAAIPRTTWEGGDVAAAQTALGKACPTDEDWGPVAS